MTRVTTTPPALRWVATFLAACAVLGLFLGFRDQIRKNPPGWYTGAEQVAVPLPTTPDTAREAVAFDPSAKAPAAPVGAATASVDRPTPAAAAPADASDDPVPVPPAPAAKIIAPPVLTPVAPAKPRPTSRPAPSADPVGDILEGQKQAAPPAPAAVPY